MISVISPINTINQNRNISFRGKFYGMCEDVFEYSGGMKFFKKIFNYAPKISEAIDVYKGPMEINAGLSTEAIKDIGGGYLKANCRTPLSTTGVRTCAILNAVNENGGESVLYHVHDETYADKIEKFLRKFIPDFTKVNIVGGDQYKTVDTMKEIVKAVDNVNPNADKIFYHTVSENPELVAYGGDMYYIKDSKGTLSFVQKDDYWY